MGQHLTGSDALLEDWSLALSSHTRWLRVHHTHEHTHTHTIAMMKHHDHKQTRRKGFILLIPDIKGSQDRNHTQELTQRLWRSAT